MADDFEFSGGAQYYYKTTALRTAANALAASHGATANANTYEHAYTSAKIAYEHTVSEARVLGDAREYNSAYKGDFSPENPKASTNFKDSYKDLWNNEVGRRIADYVKNNNLPESAINDLINDAYDNNELIRDGNDTRIPDLDPGPGRTPHDYFDPEEVPWRHPSPGYVPPTGQPPDPPAPPEPPADPPPGSPAGIPRETRSRTLQSAR